VCAACCSSTWSVDPALLWMELAVVAATTGPTNLVAHALCRNAEELHHYLTRKAALDAIARIETEPVLRTCQAAAMLRTG
jgi:hypothetical protein